MSLPAAKKRKLSVPAEESHSGEKDEHSSADKKKPGPTERSHLQNSHIRPGNAASTAELAVASGQFKSNTFKFQIDELLSQLRVDNDKQLGRLQVPLRRLEEIIKNAPDIPSMSVWEAEKALRKRTGILVPFPEPRPSKESKYTVEFRRPLKIGVAGSVFLGKGAKASDANTVDLAVTIPSSLFQKKDYVNHRYFYKRAYYVACVAAGIQDAKDPAYEISFTYQDGNTLRPIILVRPTEAADEAFVHSNVSIRIVTEIEPDVFPPAHTYPTSNTLRQTQDGRDNVAPGGAVPTDPTPVYNGSLRSEACVSLYLKVLHKARAKCAAFSDACVLGQVWLRQRGFDSTFTAGGFGLFEWTILIALLLETGGPNGKPLLSPTYSSYQIFKATIQFLLTNDLTRPLVLFPTETHPQIPSSGFPVLYDGQRELNVLYKMSPWSYTLLRHESRITLTMLNDSLRDQFFNVFLARVSEPLCRFDQVVSMTPQTTVCSTLDTVRYLSAVYDILLQALTGRVKLINLACPQIQPWSIQSRRPSLGEKEQLITIGLTLDSEHADRIIDHGPSAEDNDAAGAFRTFWGEKSELRRFKDGRILESLVWSDKPQDGPVIQQIMAYIMNQHFGLESDRMVFVGCNSISQFEDKSRPSKTASQNAMDSFDSFEKEFQNLEGLPLNFHQLSPSSPLLRHTSSLFTNPDSSTVSPADIVLQFESSSRWPDDLVAIQMTKLAFLIKIGELLEDAQIATECRVGLEYANSNISNIAFLDIRYSPLTCFRLRIYHDREHTLLEKRLKDSSIGSREKREAADALAAHKRTFALSVRHTQAIKTLATRFPLLSPTISAFKSWASSHLFIPYLREELLELLVCYAFLYPFPYEAPSSVLTGLLRVLDLLSRWDWAQEPLIVDFNDELSADSLSDIKNRFDAWRKLDPAMNIVSFFVASNLDPDGVTWTQFAKPPKVVAARVSTLAKAAMKLVREQGVSLEVPNLFRSPLTDYNFVVYLSPAYLAQRRKGTSVFKNIREGSSHNDVVGYKSVLDFVGELNRLYGQHIMFFHGDDRTKVVAGVWNPQIDKSKSFALKQGYSTCPAKSSHDAGGTEDEVTVNKTAILNEIALLGGNLVTEIQVNS